MPPHKKKKQKNNFPQYSKLLYADTHFCFRLLNIWAALVMVGDWEDQEPPFILGLFVQKKLKQKTQFKHFCQDPRDEACVHAYVSLSCLSLLFFFSLSKFKPLLSHIYLCILAVLQVYVSVSEEETAFSCKLVHFLHFISQIWCIGSVGYWGFVRLLYA